MEYAIGGGSRSQDLTNDASEVRREAQARLRFGDESGVTAGRDLPR